MSLSRLVSTLSSYQATIKHSVKPTIIYITLLITSVGCHSGSTESVKDSHQENIVSANPIQEPEPSKSDNSSGPIWVYDFDESINDFKLIKFRDVAPDILTAPGIEEIINRTWPKIQIKYVSIAHDTILISIPESEVFTQQMGTAGARQFMISTTYSFTELPSVNYVKYEFEIGDHATPGVYQRGSWGVK